VYHWLEFSSQWHDGPYSKMANRLEALDVHLKECYNHDLEWNLLPIQLREVCSIFNNAQSLPHTPLILQVTQLLLIYVIFLLRSVFCSEEEWNNERLLVLLGILSLISFCLGHAATDVKEFWTEPIITWMAIVLPTGVYLEVNAISPFNLSSSNTCKLFKNLHDLHQFCSITFSEMIHSQRECFFF